ncbi:soluble epoxide hydrolase / lipid-phosphate phosphatase [Marchantia polymorpha subsp. ruderalis]|uniref:soluble epoxide hydrolase n=2 Tax=Marchantia polymorpha TaxID=3197 RepID=A0A176VGS5_MARPO|nr:hypothetical protein AXG93_3818s1010 [Marchantia polymorpha subsp. ruderalis]PTQ50458.1 hypothetical protein MARPO_0001s0421 [Marchantia polymorpha]BBM99377.1 hypothetical protein Mp_1g20860 [Marchantia polymorpha subsp. ruderalis]|eukprot:PTQ50458.1 hypothetical protein MARPO_0001s0421 [Marchantia polymorpha]
MSPITHRFVKTNGINMHIAEAGSGPTVILVHGFPDFWYSWRHQLSALAGAGFHAVAPDVRGFGETDVPIGAENYTAFDITGDLVGLINALGDERVFVVGHDWGAEHAWNLALLWPDKIRGVVTLSVPYSPRQEKGSSLKILGSRLGDGWYMSQFQKPGYAESEFRRIGLSTFLGHVLLSSSTKPWVIPEGKSLGDDMQGPVELTPWLTAEDLDRYVEAFEKSGLTGPINVYRAIERTWEQLAPYTKAKIQAPAFFIAGSRDIVWHVPGTRAYVEGGGLKHFVPNLRGYVVLDSGHFMQQEKSEEVNQLLIKFLQQELNQQSRL